MSATYACVVQQAIVDFEQDAKGDWVAKLSCGHRQHVRHRPPVELRPWVLTDESRMAEQGTTRDCSRCDEPAGRDRPNHEPAPAGEPACYLHLICKECGVLLDGSPHAVGCRTNTPT